MILQMYPFDSVLFNDSALFNDALNTFYLRLYGVRHMVKDHLDSEKGNPLPPHVLLFPMNNMHRLIERITHTTVFTTPIVEQIAPWIRHEGSIRRPIAP